MSPLLQKKLQELEASLTAAGHDPPLDPQRRTSYDDDVDKRFVFLRNLLSAELASQPDAPDQLREIGQRLVGLEAALFDRSQSRNGTPSVCSDCTHALLNADDRESDGSTTAAAEAEDFPRARSPDSGDKNGEAATKRRAWGGIWKYCGAFVCGAIVGAIGVVELFSPSSLQFIQYESLPFPPT